MARPNPKSRAKDMFLSMGVLLVPLVLVIAFFTMNPDGEVEAIDIAPDLQRAEAEAPYPVLRAESLPDGWKPVRSAWAKDGAKWIDNKPADGNTWMAGYMGPDGVYYGIEQRDRGVENVVRRVTREGQETGRTVDAAGMQWQAYESSDGRTTSLVAKRDGWVAVVAADTHLDAITAFATSLAPVVE